MSLSAWVERSLDEIGGCHPRILDAIDRYCRKHDGVMPLWQLHDVLTYRWGWEPAATDEALLELEAQELVVLHAPFLPFDTTVQSVSLALRRRNRPRRPRR